MKSVGRIPAKAVVVTAVAMTAVAVIDAASGPRVVLAGLLAAGPCPAALSGKPRAVIVLGGYALTLISVLAWHPDRIFGTSQHLLGLLATVAVTVAGFIMAHRIRRQERFAHYAHPPLRRGDRPR